MFTRVHTCYFWHTALFPTHPFPPPALSSSPFCHPSYFHLSQAAEKSSPSPQLAVVPVQERPKKSTPLFKASLNLSAPVIILPMALGGGVVLDLGDVSLNAAPEYKNDSTVAALVAKVQLSAAQLYRSGGCTPTATPTHVLCSFFTHSHPFCFAA